MQGKAKGDWTTDNNILGPMGAGELCAQLRDVAHSIPSTTQL